MEYCAMPANASSIELVASATNRLFSNLYEFCRRTIGLPIVLLVPLAILVAWDATKEGLALWRLYESHVSAAHHPRPTQGDRQPAYVPGIEPRRPPASGGWIGPSETQSAPLIVTPSESGTSESMPSMSPDGGDATQPARTLEGAGRPPVDQPPVLRRRRLPRVRIVVVRPMTLPPTLAPLTMHPMAPVPMMRPMVPHIEAPFVWHGSGFGGGPFRFGFGGGRPFQGNGFGSGGFRPFGGGGFRPFGGGLGQGYRIQSFGGFGGRRR